MFHRTPIVIGIASALFFIAGCFTADEEPKDEDLNSISDDDTESDDTVADDTVDDDDSADDTAADDTASDDDTESDDTAADDDTIDDDTAPDDDADDDTQPGPNCQLIVDAVYDSCAFSFTRKGPPDEPLTKEDALAACLNDDFWTCVQTCVDENPNPADCPGLYSCVNSDPICNGGFYLS